MVNGQRVLVVDGMQEIQEVLQAVLAPRGLRVDWVRSHVQQHASATADHPDILVIDAEALPIQRTGGTRHWNNVPQVIIGAEQDSATEANDQHTYIAKPFLFPDLIRAIEKLLPAKVA